MMPRAMVRGKPSETELKMTLITGTEIYVIGLDVPARIEGPPWDGFVFDECDDIKKTAWEDNIFPCFLDRKAWAIFLGVPNGLNKLYEFSKYHLTDDDWAFFTWPSSEVMPIEEIDKFKDKMVSGPFGKSMRHLFRHLAA